MQSRVDLEEMAIELSFESAEELVEFARAAAEQRGFLIELRESLKLYTECRVALVAGDRRVVVAAEVVQVFAGAEGVYRTAFQTTDGETLGAVEPAKSAEPEEGGETGPAAGDAASEAAVSPAFRIREMNVSQKMILAMKANRTERQILTRDGSPQVLMGLLANARIEEKEVLEIVKSPHAASGVLQRVAKDGRWSRNYEIRLAVVKNPKTPPLLAQRLLPSLRKKDLQVLAKGSHVREAVKGAALRLYLKKM